VSLTPIWPSSEQWLRTRAKLLGRSLVHTKVSLGLDPGKGRGKLGQFMLSIPFMETLAKARKVTSPPLRGRGSLKAKVMVRRVKALPNYLNLPPLARNTVVKVSLGGILGFWNGWTTPGHLG